MSVVCQNVATLTTATVVTTFTVYVSTLLSQGVGLPTTLTQVVPTAACSATVIGNATSQVCATRMITSTQVIAPSPTQIQVPVTVSRQIVQTQVNTLFGSACTTVNVPPSRPPSQPPTQPSPQSPTSAPPPAAITDTTYTTHFVTVTGLPSDTTTSNTPSSTSTSRSRTTIYGISGTFTTDVDPTDTAIGAVAPSSSSNAPVGPIVGGVVGGLVLFVLIGLGVYFLIFKKSPKGYERPGAQESGMYPQMQDQGGYSPYQDGADYSHQLQGSGTGEYSGHLQQEFDGQNLYTDNQDTGAFWQPNLSSVAAMGGPSAVAAIPVGAAAVAISRHSPHPSTSSSGRPASQLSTAPLLNRRPPHYQQPSQGSYIVPYRGFAEPSNDP